MDHGAEYFIAMSTALEVRSRTAWYPDAGPPSECHLDFVARVEYSELSGLADVGARTVALERADFESLLALGAKAIAAGGGESGADTAIGRKITAIELELYRFDRDGPPAHAIYSLNHCAISSDGPPSWRALLVELRAHFGRAMVSPICERLEWTLGWFATADPRSS